MKEKKKEDPIVYVGGQRVETNDGPVILLDLTGEDGQLIQAQVIAPCHTCPECESLVGENPECSTCHDGLPEPEDDA